jgi:hypothetical protein
VVFFLFASRRTEANKKHTFPWMNKRKRGTSSELKFEHRVYSTDSDGVNDNGADSTAAPVSMSTEARAASKSSAVLLPYLKSMSALFQDPLFADVTFVKGQEVRTPRCFH